MSLVGTFLIERNQVRTSTTECKGLRFSCLRCGTFCCRLGGPVVTQKDLDRLGRSRPQVDISVETMSIGPHVITALTSKPNGECVLFSRGDKEKGVCLEYRHRPDACRTYPFEFVKEGRHLTVRALPCRGLNQRKGRLVDERFIQNRLGFATATRIAAGPIEARQRSPPRQS